MTLLMPAKARSWLYDVSLIVVLVSAAWLRFTGAGWGELQYQHPDELFLSGVAENLRGHVCADTARVRVRRPHARGEIDSCPPDQQRWLTLAEFFNTGTSPLNPNNRGAPYYVYGTLPLFLVRYIYELLPPGTISLTLLGRHLAALADVSAILLFYLVAAHIYRRPTALLAALFSALAVMQIQQSHFFTVDSFTSPFLCLALYFAVKIAYDPARTTARDPYRRSSLSFASLTADVALWNSAFFGMALGLAASCKLNAAALALVLPGALALRFWGEPFRRRRPAERTTEESPSPGVHGALIAIYLFVGALLTLATLRIFQPYAFVGFSLNPRWISNLREQYAQATGTADLPWNLQWARRTHLYSFTNLTVWGLGLPLGLLAWAGFSSMAWRILKGERKHILLWAWTAFYFGWQSLQFNPTMRYQLPIYPLLCLMAAWVVCEFPHASGQRKAHGLVRRLVLAIGGLVLIATTAWAVAFSSIYTREEPRIAASRWIYQNIPGAANLGIRTTGGSIYNQPLSMPSGITLSPSKAIEIIVVPQRDGVVTHIALPHIANVDHSNATLAISITDRTSATSAIRQASGTVTSPFTAIDDPRGRPATLTLEPSFHVERGQSYSMSFSATGGTLLLAASTVANETDYDWSLPFRIDDYDPFGGVYRGDLNLQVYQDDDAAKLARVESVLDQADYIFVPTNHQYAQITRIPERYPLTTTYYRELLGCPTDREIIWCYRVAEPGAFTGRLGFDLVKTFESYPTLGPLVINDQSAEEAFTFYDHPKVLIFKKRADFDLAQVRSVLRAVDLTRVVRLTPLQASSYRYEYRPPGQQESAGTWSESFRYSWILNRQPIFGLVIWYLLIFFLGIVAHWIGGFAFVGLEDQGYPLARVLGLALLGYLSWLGGSLGVPVTRSTIAVLFAFLTMGSVALAWARRQELAQVWRVRKTYFLMIEGLFLIFFLFDLLIRIGNPDLWHPDRGGERPMDFSYFNAVLKSDRFPPYDPWFAGGSINYYYYGFVLVAVPVKLLGIVPAIAYNFILPTLFSMVAMGAFSLAWNLLARGREDKMSSSFRSRPFVAGLVAALLMAVLGNLGTLRMIYQGLERMVAAGGTVHDSGIVQGLAWAIQGLIRVLAGERLPFAPGDWYWSPSRIIPPGPGNEITEFPFFTFLYGDLHAHMMAMPLALLVLGWALSTVLARKASPPSLLVAAMIIGALYPTNLSDIYTYLPAGLAALAYALWRGDDSPKGRTGLSAPVRKCAAVLGGTLLLAALSVLLYAPYRASYSQAYGRVVPWMASRTPIGSYLTHWGVFSFIIASWMTWETRQWMAQTPVSALNKLRPFRTVIYAIIATFFVLLLYLAYLGLQIAWVALPLALWSGILLLRPGMPDTKRFVLFLVGTACLVTVVVELFVVEGDIGRMNTVFKFYLQAWILLSVSTGAAFAWTLAEIHDWSKRWRGFFYGTTALLLGGAALYTIMGTRDKISDRMARDVPLTLDGIAYMQYARYSDFGVTMDLDQDYRAIRWMQDHVQGSPVIVEANCSEYRWCTRFTVYTGLPGVVGWNWHQRQQRPFTPGFVADRVAEISSFYATTDAKAARDFLKKYDVKYVVVGQLERAEYPAEGVAKFERYDGQLWNSVYRDGDTVIYRVL